MATYTCPNCRGKVRDTDRSCPTCGTPISEVRKGGKAVPDIAAGVKTAAPAKKEKKKSSAGGKVFLAIFIAALVVAAAVLIANRVPAEKFLPFL